MANPSYPLDQQLAAAQKTIKVLMERVEQDIDTSVNLQGLFADNINLQQRLSSQLRAEKELQDFNKRLEQLVAERTSELQTALDRLNKKNSYLKEIVRRDGLTGLYNHSTILQIVGDKINEARRYAYPLSLIILDLDYFKRVNDTYGHLFGDHVLKTVARHLLQTIRNVDFAGRLGGEEFAVLLPSTSLKGALTTAEKIRSSISNLTWEHKDFRVTLSGGVVRYENDTVESMVARADKYLYMAKKNGRNKICSMQYVQLRLPTL